MKGFIEVHQGKNSIFLNISQIVEIEDSRIVTTSCAEDEWFDVQESYDEIKQKIEEAQQ